MCKSIKDCLFCRCPPTSSCCARKWSQDATKQARNSSQHRIRDFGVGLLAVPVEKELRAEYHLILGMHRVNYWQLHNKFTFPPYFCVNYKFFLSISLKLDPENYALA